MIAAEDLQCLKALAVRGGCRGPIFVSTQSIGEMLGISQQTASRRLKGLETSGYITRALSADGQHVTVTKSGEEVLRRLGEQPGNIGFYLPALAKGDFFRTVVRDGALPRKTFSMGEADEKRFYLECRQIVA